MSIFNLEQSLAKAERRFARAGGYRPRRRRSDRGKLRLDPAIHERLRELLLGDERPRMAGVQRELAAFCATRGLPCPSRATVYKAASHVEGHLYPVSDLPAAPRAALHNLDDDAIVPGAQLAFACFHHGGLDAVSYAAGLPWLDLHQAAEMRGWRERSRGLLDAARRARGI